MLLWSAVRNGLLLPFTGIQQSQHIGTACTCKLTYGAFAA